MATIPKVLGPEKDYAGEGQQYIQKTRPLVREGVPGARHQDLLIDCQSQCDFDFETHPCEGGVEYLHCDLASRGRLRKRKSQI
jgi:hypothetical protein